uniref:C-JID domain-containing protein n=1 Tax=Quercus lobata TaxID=97700 RepID=A0A7N2LDH0_QUELO
MKIFLPSNLYNKPDWIGLAICAIFSSHKNPTAASGFSHMVICQLKTNLGCMNPLLYYGIREVHVLTSLHQQEFLWESIISHWLLSPEWSECTWVEFSFVSDSSDVSVLKCAVDLVYGDNLENFTLTMAPCITSYNDPFTLNERLPFYHRGKSNDSDGLYEDQTNGTSGQYSYRGQHPRYQLCQTAVSDFFPSAPYNCCFPPSKIQDWFSNQNHGCSATMDLPSNLYHNSNWKGLVLYASFSIQGDSNFILGNLNSGKSHSLYCQCQMSMVNVDDQTIAFSTSKEEIMWLLELGEFIWISYVPGEPFKNMSQHCSHIEASFVSDWPGVIVQKCALQLLFQHDQVQFEEELKHCNNLILENRELVRKQQEDQ